MYGRWLAYVYLPGRRGCSSTPGSSSAGSRARSRSRPTSPIATSWRRSSGERLWRARACGRRAPSRGSSRLRRCVDILGLAVILVAAAAAARAVSRRFDHVSASGNGHAADEQRVAMLRAEHRGGPPAAAGRDRQRARASEPPHARRARGGRLGAGGVGAVRVPVAADTQARRAGRGLPPAAGRPVHPAPVRLPRRHAVAQHAHAAKGGRVRRSEQPDLVAITGDIVAHPPRGRPGRRAARPARSAAGHVRLAGQPRHRADARPLLARPRGRGLGRRPP